MARRQRIASTRCILCAAALSALLAPSRSEATAIYAGRLTVEVSLAGFWDDNDSALTSVPQSVNVEATFSPGAGTASAHGSASASFGLPTDGELGAFHLVLPGQVPDPGAQEGRSAFLKGSVDGNAVFPPTSGAESTFLASGLLLIENATAGTSFDLDVKMNLELSAAASGAGEHASVDGWIIWFPLSLFDLAPGDDIDGWIAENQGLLAGLELEETARSDGTNTVLSAKNRTWHHQVATAADPPFVAYFYAGLSGVAVAVPEPATGMLLACLAAFLATIRRNARAGLALAHSRMLPS